jgi:16S rRNA (uracil1498-N3)-methyltransferase
MRQLLLDIPQPLSDGTLPLAWPISRDVRHRLERVLRLPVGAPLLAADGLGRRVPVRWLGAEVAVDGPVENSPAVVAPFVLAAGLIKGDRWDWLVEKASELGVDSLQPLACDHAVVRVDPNKSTDKRQRWQAVAQEAFEQCGRPLLCQVAAPLPLRQWLTRLGPQDSVLVCDETLPALTLADAALPVFLAQPPRRLHVVVGPEGGLSAEEWQALDRSGAQRVRLSQQVLRAETAGLAAAVIVAMVREGLL